MDYGRIINRSFEIAWKYKSLWVFGMFTSYGFSSFNLDIPRKDFHEIPQTPFDIFNIPKELLVMFVLSLLAMFLIWFVISVISKGAIIDSINRIDRGGRYRFGDAFSAGIDFFLRMLGVFVLGAISQTAVAVIIIFIIVIAFMIHTAIGVLSLMILVPALIFSIFFLVSLFGLAQRVLVVRNCGIGASLEEGYYLVKNNLGKVAVIALITLGFSIGLAILAGMIWAFFALPIAAMGFLASMDIITALLAGIAVGLPISFVVGGITGVFFTSLITLFYFELVEPRKAPAAQMPPAAAPLT